MSNNDEEMFDDFDLDEGLDNNASKETVVSENVSKPVMIGAVSTEELKEKLDTDIKATVEAGTKTGEVINNIPKKITKEDNENYDKHLEKFLEQKKEELKGKPNGMDKEGTTVSIKDNIKDDKAVNSDSAPVDTVSNSTLSKEKDKPEEKKAKRVTKNKEKIEEVPEDIKVLNSTIASQEKKIAKLEKQLEDFKASNTIIIDAQSTDDRKKVKELMSEGKIIANKSNDPFIIADVPTADINPVYRVTHTVYCKDITSIDIHNYFLDLSLDVFDRKFVKKLIWVFHKGYHSCDLITEEQAQYLIDNGFVTNDMINYFISDMSKGRSYFKGHDKKDITIEEVERIDKQYEKHVVSSNVEEKKEPSDVDVDLEDFE